MTMYGRNDRNAFAALSSEEERRRAHEVIGGMVTTAEGVRVLREGAQRREAAKRPRPDVEDIEGAGTGGDLRRGLANRILSAIRHAFVR